MTYASRVDANQGDIVDRLREAGWSVLVTSRIRGGFPDLLCGVPGFCCLVEVKDGSKPPSARKLSKDEQQFAEEWTGPYIVALSPEDALTKLEAERTKTC